MRGCPEGILGCTVCVCCMCMKRVESSARLAVYAVYAVYAQPPLNVEKPPLIHHPPRIDPPPLCDGIEPSAALTLRAVREIREREREFARNCSKHVLIIY